MALRTLVAATVAAVVAVATQVSAHVPAPLVPTALVEDVKSATADIEFMDYVGNGQVIKLAPGDVLVLSYLKSCEHETITGGTVIVGAERSEVRDGQIVRTKVPCDGGKIRLSSQQASKSAASAFRLQSADIQPTLYARTPVVQLPKVLASEDRTLLIERIDRRGERHELKIDDASRGRRLLRSGQDQRKSRPRRDLRCEHRRPQDDVPDRRQGQIRPGAGRQPPAALPIAPSGRRRVHGSGSPARGSGRRSDCARRGSPRRLTRTRRVARASRSTC